MSLEQLRKQIDEINVEMVKLLQRRVMLAQAIARWKKEYAYPIEDLNREQIQYEELKHLAEQCHLHPSVIEQVFSIVIEYCKERMHQEEES